MVYGSVMRGGGSGSVMIMGKGRSSFFTNPSFIVDINERKLHLTYRVDLIVVRSKYS